ncbi:MAG: methionyl-tRNA formyltransferase [Planctomycetota bacterium]|nr:methionyl-tRNA formyltransferase [Planctomycetota bacterium]
MRLIFLGAGEFGLPTLQHLHATHELLAVVSQPDKPAGRRRKLTPTPIAGFALEKGLTLLRPEDVNAPEVVAPLAALKADAAVVIAFGQKLGPELLAALGGLTVNLHSSLLPKLRGAAPINWAILNGEARTGLSVIALAQRMDAGLVYAQAATPIDPRETAGELHDRLAVMGPGIVESVLTQWKGGTLKGEVQDESLATRAPKLSKADASVSFDATAEEVRRRVHGLTPWPGVQVGWVASEKSAEKLAEPAGAAGPGEMIFLRRVAAEPASNAAADRGAVRDGAEPGTLIAPDRVAVRDGAVRLLEVQAPGGKPMPIADFLRGHRMKPGDRLVRWQPMA